MLIREVPEAELDQLKAAAKAQNMSLQSYLLDALHAQAAYLRRQAALNRVRDRLHGRPAVDELDRQAVLDAVDGALAERADQLAR